MISANKIMKPKYHHYTYRDTLAASEKVNWRVEDIIGGEKKLDFTKPFMPETLARTEMISFLSPSERLALNQIRGNGYLALFGLLEEVILPFVLDHARAQLVNDEYCVRSFLEFAGEEAKHLHLFKRFREEFQRGFGTDCEMIGPVDQIARNLLSHQSLAVALFVLQGEWMTQSHYTDSVSGNDELDPQFKSLLKHHWMEEAQHAKLDTLMVDALAASLSDREIEGAVEEYFEITSFMDAGLKQQVEYDLESLIQATGRKFSADERKTFKKVQHQALRWTFLVSGMSHPNFLATLEYLVPDGRSRVERAAVAFL
jgi:hypothetical protein